MLKCYSRLLALNHLCGVSLLLKTWSLYQGTTFSVPLDSSLVAALVTEPSVNL